MKRKQKLSVKIQQSIFKEIFVLRENQICADCNAQGPTWCSIDFGVFICLKCSGVHRAIGPHITRVRSTKLDQMFLDNVEVLKYVGNKKANRFYEHRLQNSGIKPKSHSSDMSKRKQFIYDKYLKQRWAQKGEFPPAKIFKDNRENGIYPDQFTSDSSSSDDEDEDSSVQNTPTPSNKKRKKSVQIHRNSLRRSSAGTIENEPCNLLDFSTDQPQEKETEKDVFEDFFTAPTNGQTNQNILQSNAQMAKQAQQKAKQQKPVKFFPQQPKQNLDLFSGLTKKTSNQQQKQQQQFLNQNHIKQKPVQPTIFNQPRQMNQQQYKQQSFNNQTNPLMNQQKQYNKQQFGNRGGVTQNKYNALNTHQQPQQPLNLQNLYQNKQQINQQQKFQQEHKYDVFGQMQQRPIYNQQQQWQQQAQYQQKQGAYDKYNF